MSPSPSAKGPKPTHHARGSPVEDRAGAGLVRAECSREPRVRRVGAPRQRPNRRRSAGPLGRRSRAVRHPRRSRITRYRTPRGGGEPPHATGIPVVARGRDVRAGSAMGAERVDRPRRRDARAVLRGPRVLLQRLQRIPPRGVPVAVRGRPPRVIQGRRSVLRRARRPRVRRVRTEGHAPRRRRDAHRGVPRGLRHPARRRRRFRQRPAAVANRLRHRARRQRRLVLRHRRAPREHEQLPDGERNRRRPVEVVPRALVSRVRATLRHRRAASRRRIFHAEARGWRDGGGGERRRGR